MLPAGPMIGNGYLVQENILLLSLQTLSGPLSTQSYLLLYFNISIEQESRVVG